MKPVRTVEEAKKLIESFSGRAEEFELPIADELQDSVGIHMAIITDYILGKGWEPNGFNQKAGFRVYRYKVLE